MLLKLCLKKMVIPYCGAYLHFEICFMLFLIFMTSQRREEERGLLVYQDPDTIITYGDLRVLRACD